MKNTMTIIKVSLLLAAALVLGACAYDGKTIDPNTGKLATAAEIRASYNNFLEARQKEYDDKLVENTLSAQAMQTIVDLVETRGAVTEEAIGETAAEINKRSELIRSAVTLGAGYFLPEATIDGLFGDNGDLFLGTATGLLAGVGGPMTVRRLRRKT